MNGPVLSDSDELTSWGLSALVSERLVQERIMQRDSIKQNVGSAWNAWQEILSLERAMACLSLSFIYEETFLASVFKKPSIHQ